MRLDPDDWAAVYESERPSGQMFAFRHGVEVARDVCLARASPGARWADVGCGTGHLGAQLAAAGLDVWGVDNNPSMLEAAAQRFGSRTLSGTLRFELAEAGQLPFDDAAVDGVVATSLVGCLERPTEFFREVDRVLRPGGTAVVTFTNRSSVLHAIGRRLSGAHRRQSALNLPIRSFSIREARAELEEAGLAVDEVRFYNCFISLNGSMIPGRSLALRLERALSKRGGKCVARNFVIAATR